MLQTPGVLADGRPLTYALGLRVEPYRGLRTVSHGGAWVGYRAELLRFPDQHLSVACLCNLSDISPSRLARRVAEIYLADEMEGSGDARGTEPTAASARAIALDASQLPRYAGLYRDPRTGTLLRFAVRADTLYGYAPDLSNGRRLAPVAVDHFQRGDGVGVLFQGGSSRQAERVRIWAGTDTVVAERIAEAKPSPAELARYAGTYDSNEIDATYTIAIEGSTLMLRRRRAEPVALIPTYADAFAADGLLFTFERRGGRITGMAVDDGRTRGLVFTKRTR
jgi:hypothetical protein